MAEANAHFANYSEVEGKQESRELEQNQLPTEHKMENPLEKLLQRQRSEIMNELSNIENRERPVTGQCHRNNINSFFAKHLTEPAGSNGKENVPANVDRVEEHRPESVVVEVQGLFEQHRVSSILQSPAFRRQLESVIRGSISSASRQPSRQHRNGVRVASPVPNSGVAAAVVAPTPLPRTTRRVSLTSTEISETSETSEDSSTVNINQDVPEEIGVWRPVLTSPPQPLSWENVSQIQREELVEEISELLHNRLVSTSLEGEFRGLLEVQLQNQLQQTDADGENVANFVRSLPRTQPIIHNDFSHLGLQAPADNFDNISVTSLSATAVPYTHSNLYLSREIHSLKAQMLEMKNMIKLNFDLSLDIQRAVRQEVAAGIAMATGENVATTAAPASTRSMPVNDSQCVICLENYSDSVLYQCGHMCVCYACGKHLLSLRSKCPMCRAPIKDIIRAYKCTE